MVLQIILVDILLVARIFPRPCGARKNTTQLVKYPLVLSVKPSNKVYLLTHTVQEKYYMHYRLINENNKESNKLCIKNNLILTDWLTGWVVVVVVIVVDWTGLTDGRTDWLTDWLIINTMLDLLILTDWLTDLFIYFATFRNWNRRLKSPRLTCSSLWMKCWKATATNQ